MRRRMQFSLRTLLIGACIVGPAMLHARRLFDLSYLGLMAMAIGVLVLAAILIPQAVLLKIVMRSCRDLPCLAFSSASGRCSG